MGFEEVKEWSFKLFKKLGRRELFQAFVVLKNIIEDLTQENKKYKEETQQLRDLVNKLKGEKGKPDIRPPKKKGDLRSIPV
ncbi:MAG: hypothetical protein A2381_17220 [Bdellovibrionales bacterium RIFOXYB1_FULL_37_110]|nr:MAG: hypothetical protein A2181_08225 [Bdellovibrionales bacterium RIFOXYA1_FULL_38_20]OFZ50136.1 MAG: hypothetical protein A2417_19055 [Bdellovibrionales bacterium RIFOXYC1_FULL_37_79]OFZ60042.1 MAG: hypothetical protein A2381_17220 [Bdellovibrionales bacterium RIFOXYB1_FULL_37_110]